MWLSWLPSLEQAKSLQVLFNIFLVIGAVGTLGAIWISGVIADYSDARNRASDEKIAELSAETEKSKAEALKFKAEIATANENAATANEKAAKANLELEKLRARNKKVEESLASRHLTQEQKNIIKNIKAPGIVIELHVLDDKEIKIYANEIREAFNQGGMQVNWVVDMTTGIPKNGISISFDPHNPNAVLVYEAFIQADLNPSIEGQNEGPVVTIYVDPKASEF